MAPTVYWGNGHYYEWVDASWYFGSAQYYAGIRTHQGLQGYLATVTSQGENDFIRERSNNNAAIGGNAYLGAQWIGSYRKWEWKTGPEAGLVFWDNWTAVPNVYSNWQSAGPNGDGGSGSPDAMQMYANRGSDTGKWDDLGQQRDYITEYGWSGPQFTVGLTGTPINGIENSNAARFTITANKYVPNDYYDVRNTDGNTNALINIPLTFGGTATLGVDYTVSYSNGLGGNGSNAYIKNGSSVDVIITPINDTTWESTKDVTINISDNDVNNDTYAIAQGATTFQRAILSDDEPVLTIGNSLRKSIYFPYNDSNVSLDSLTADYTTFDATINASSAEFHAEGLVDNFAVRWQAYVKIPTTGQYVFTARGDDGMRLKVNNNQVINQWQVQGATSYNSTPIQLTAGSWVPVQLDYYQGNGGKEVSLSWTRPNPNGGAAITELIPATAFAPYLPAQPTGSVSEGSRTADTIAPGFAIYSNRQTTNLDVKAAIASTGGATYSSQSSQMATFNNASRNALQLNGSTYLNVGNPSKLQLSTGTIEAWIKTSDAGSGDRNIFGKGECFELKLVNNKLTLYNFQGGVQTVIQPDLYLNDNRWHHVALAYGAGSASVYVDGKQVGNNSYTYNSPSPAANNVTIGGWSNYSQPTNASFDEVRIWNRKLTGDEIKNYNTYPLDQGNLPAGLVAYFPMDEGSGSTVFDKTANPSNASIIGTANWAGPVQASANNQGFAQLGGSQTRVGDNYKLFANETNANSGDGPLGGTGLSSLFITTSAQPGQNFLSLNGTNQYATLPQKTFGGSLTIESWVKVNSYSNWSRIIDLGNGAGQHNIILGQLASTGRLFFHVYDGSGNRLVDLEPPTQIPLNEWTHVAATIDAQRNVKLYMNGAVIGTAVASGLPAIMQRSNNYVGRSNWGGDNAFLNGSIDELRIYNTARSADTISNDRFNTVNPGDPSLVYAYNFSNDSSSLTTGSAISRFNGASLASSSAADGSAAAHTLWLRVLNDTYAKPNQQIQLDLVDNAYGITADGYRIVGGSNSLTINDNAPVVSILSKVDPTEGSLGYVDLSFDRPVLSPTGLKIKYTLSGSATPGQDYLYPTARLNTDSNSTNYEAQNIVYFAPDSTGGRIYLPGVEDAVAEGLETIQFSLVDNAEANNQGFTYTSYAIAANASQISVNLKDSGYYAPGVAITAPGKTGTAALRLNGSSDRLRTSISEAASGVSREIVFRTSSANGGLYQLDASATSNFLGLYLQNGNLVSKLGPSSQLSTSNRNYADGNWHRALVTLGSNGGHRLYVDGQLVASSASQTTATGGPFSSSFVGFNGNGGSTGSYFNGDIRSLRNWDQELTPNQASGLPTALPAAKNWLDFNSNRIVDYTAAAGSLASSLVVEGSLQTVPTTVVRATSSNTAAVQLKLTSQPTATVTMVITASNATVASGASLTFTASNWDTAQTVNLSAISASQLASMTATASSSDGNYNRTSTLSVLPFGWSGSQQLDLVEGGPVVAIVPVASIAATNNSQEGLSVKSGFDLVLSAPIAAGGGELLFTLNQGLTGNSIAKVDPSGQGSMLSGGILQLNSATNGYATLPTKSIGGALTIESWVKVNSYSNWSRIIDLGNGAGQHNIVLGQLASTGRLFFHVYDGSNRIATLEPQTQIPLNEWTHVAATIDDQRNVKLYLDGSVIGTALASSLPPTIQRTNNYVGRSNWNGDDYLNGSLSDLRVYSGARTAQQISADRYSMLDSSDSTLSYAYSFNNTANSSLSGSTNAAPTLLGGAAIVPGPDLNVNVDNTYRPLQFSGASGQSLDLPNNAIGGDLSIETWVCLNSHANNATVIDIGSGVSSDNIILGFDGASGRPVFKLFKNSVKILELVASTSALPLNQWTHLAATITSNKLATIYINGVAVATGTASDSVADATRSKTRVGNSFGSSAPLNGSLRDLAIYNYSRSAEQVKADQYTNPHQGMLAADRPVWTYALNNSSLSRFSSTATGESLVNGSFATNPTYGIMLAAGSQSTSIALSSIDNKIAQGDRTVRLDVLPSASYGISGNSSSTYTLTDNDEAGLDLAVLVKRQVDSTATTIWSPLASDNYKITTSESDIQGSSITRQTIGVRLKSQPLATVTLQIPATLSQAIHVYNAGTTTPFTSLTFTPGDWSTYKMIDVVGRDDGQAAGDRTTNLSFSLANSIDTVYQTINSGVDVVTINADTLAIPTGQAAAAESTGTVAFLSTTPGGSIGEVGSLMLDGSSTGYATLPSKSIGGGPLTFETWVNLKSHSTWSRIIDLGNGPGNNNIMMGLTNDTGNLFFQVIDGSGATTVHINPSVQVPLNQWNHIAATIDSDRTTKLYLNGVVIGSAVASALPPVTTRSNNYIGRSNWQADANLNGSIRDLRLYSASRTQSQIIEDSRSAVNTADSTLTYAYGFNGNATSSRPGDLDVTRFSGASLQGGGASGLNFNGSTAQYASLTPKTLGGPLTMEAWVNVKQYTNWPSIIDLGNGVGVNQIILMMHEATGKPRFLIQNAAGNNLLDVISSVPLQLNQWAHVAATIDANKLATIYVNGVSVATGTATALPETLSRSSNLIGKASRSWHDNFNGTIRDVRVYSAARTVEQINADRFNAISADSSLVYGYDFVNSAVSATNPSEVATIVGSTFGASNGNTGSQTFTVSLKQPRSTPTQVYFQLDGNTKARVGSDININESSRALGSATNGLNQFVFDNYIQQASTDSLPVSFSRTQLDANGINETYAATYANAGSPLNYGVRWTGFVYIPNDGRYIFKSRADGGVRLTINNQLLINRWHDVATSPSNPAANYFSDEIVLEGGSYVPIVYDYYDTNTSTNRSSIAQLSWQRPNPSGVGTTNELIPANFFSVNGLDSVLIPANSTSASFTVNTVDNLVAEKNGDISFSLLSNPGIRIKAGTATQAGGLTTIKLKLDGAYQDSLTIPSGTTLQFRNDNDQANGSVVNTLTLTSAATLYNGFEVDVTGSHGNSNAFTTSLVSAYRQESYRPNLNIVTTTDFSNVGLTRTLFSNYTDTSKNLSTLVPSSSSTDSNGINETDATMSPLSPTDNFAARWTGYIKIPSTGTYTFHTVADNGVRLFVNGNTLIDNWTNSSQRTLNSTSQNYTQGQLVAVTMDYYSSTGTSTAQLQWSYSGSGVTPVTNQLVPASAFSQLSGTIGLRLNESDSSLTRSVKAGDTLQFSNGTSLRIANDVTLSTTATVVNASLPATASTATVLSGETLSLPSLPAAQVSVIDNDLPGFRISSDAAGLQTVLASDTITVNEADSSGAGVTRYLALTTQPTSTVTVYLESSASNHGLLKAPTSAQALARIPLTFTPSNWSTPQAFATVPQQDNAVSGNANFAIFASSTSNDSLYNNLKPASNGKLFNVSKTDMDTPGIVSSAVTVVTGQGSNSNGSFTLKLNSKPTSNVNVTLHPSDGQFTVNNASLNNDQTLVFTPDNWAIPQQVQVQAVANTIVQDTTNSPLQIKSTSADPNYTNLTTPDVTIAITHNTLPTVRLELVGPRAGEVGQPATWRLVSNAPVPTSWGSTGLVVGYNVTNSLSSANVIGNGTESVPITSMVQGLLSSGSIRIAPGQTTSNAFIMPIDDFAVDGVDKQFQLNLQAGSGYTLDPFASTATVSIKDNDVAGLMIALAGERTMTIEGAGASQFQVCLLSQPSDTVTIQLSDISSVATGQSGTPLGQLIVDNPTLTFTKDNWNVLQVVNVRANDDNIIEDGTGLRAYTGIHTGQLQYTFTSNDGDYSSAGKPVAHFTKTSQAIDIVDRTLDPLTYLGIDQALSAMMDGLNAMNLPIAGNLNGKTGPAINEFLDKLVDSIRTTPQLTSKKLEKLLMDASGVNTTSPITMTMDSLGVSIDYTVSDAYNLYSIPLANDFGVPALGLQVSGSFDGSFDYSARLKMGVDKTRGFYFDTANSRLDAHYKTNLSPDFSLKGGLGFLQIDAVNQPSPHKSLGIIGEPIAGLTGERTGIDATFRLKLASPLANAAESPYNDVTLLPIQKLLSTDFSNLFRLHFTGQTDGVLSVGMKASLQDFSAIPLVSFDLSTKMPLFYSTNPESPLPTLGTPEIPNPTNVFIDNLLLGMDNLIASLVKPLITAIDGVLQPIYPLIQSLYDDTRVFSRLGIGPKFDANSDGSVTVIELAQYTAMQQAMSNPNDPATQERLAAINRTVAFCDNLKAVIDLNEQLKSLSKDENFFIEYGNFVLSNFNLASTNSANSASAINVDAVSSQYNQLASGAATTLAASTRIGAGEKLSSIFNQLQALGFSVPLITEPKDIIKMLLGQPRDLITWRMPIAGLSASMDQSFNTYGLHYGTASGSFDVQTDLNFGFDTVGLQQWALSAFKPEDAHKVFDGFYVDAPSDRPQFDFDASIGVSQGIHISPMRADFNGGVLGNAQMKLLDPGVISGTSDGKLRGAEIAANSDDVTKLYLLTGAVTSSLNGQVQLGVDLGFYSYWKTVWKKQLNTLNLFSFGGTGTSASGSASNSYLQGSTVFFDSNFNGTIDPGEPTAITSQDDGSYSLEIDNRTFDTNQNGKIDPEEGMLVVYGGVDSVSKAPIRTPFVAPFGAMVTPLTSLYAYSLMMAKNFPGYSEAAVKAKIDKFFLLGNYDFLYQDPEKDLLQAEAAGQNSSFFLTPAQKTSAKNAYLAHIKLHLVSYYLETMGETVLPNLFPNDLPTKLKLNQEFYTRVIGYIEATDALNPGGVGLTVKTIDRILVDVVNGFVTYISQATSDPLTIATVKSMLGNVASRAKEAFMQLDRIADNFEGKAFFDNVNQIKAAIFTGISKEAERAVNFYKAPPALPAMANGAKVDPTNPLAFKASNIKAPDPTITKTTIEFNDTMMDFTALLEGSKTRTSLGLSLKAFGASLLSRLDPYLTGVQESGKQLAFFAIDGDGNTTPFSYDPINDVGARFYDLKRSGMADFIHLSYKDGGPGDMDGQVDGKISDPATTAVVDSTPSLRLLDARTLQIGDSTINVATALFISLTLQSNSTDLSEIGYVVLNAGDDPNAVSLADLLSNGQILFSSLAKASSLSIGSTGLSRDLQITNNQKLLCFEVRGTSIQELAAGKTSVAELGSQFQFLTWSAQEGSKTASLNSTSGLSIQLNLNNSAPGLNALVSCDQSFAPVLNTSALSGDQLTGVLSYNREASFNSTVGFYQVLDRNGSLFDAVTGRTLDPTALQAGDQARYRELALLAANRAAALDGIATTNGLLAQKEFSVVGGAFYSPFAIVASTQQTYFAFAAANTDGVNHFKMMGANVFGLEDMHGGGDQDYNDLLVGIDFKSYVPI